MKKCDPESNAEYLTNGLLNDDIEKKEFHKKNIQATILEEIQAEMKQSKITS